MDNLEEQVRNLRRELKEMTQEYEEQKRLKVFYQEKLASTQDEMQTIATQLYRAQVELRALRGETGPQT